MKVIVLIVRRAGLPIAYSQGFNPQPLYYQYYLHRIKEIPNINPSNPKFDLPKSIWQRLPLPITKWLGPKLVRGIP